MSLMNKLTGLHKIKLQSSILEQDNVIFHTFQFLYQLDGAHNQFNPDLQIYRFSESQRIYLHSRQLPYFYFLFFILSLNSEVIIYKGQAIVFITLRSLFKRIYLNLPQVHPQEEWPKLNLGQVSRNIQFQKSKKYLQNYSSKMKCPLRIDNGLNELDQNVNLSKKNSYYYYLFSLFNAVQSSEIQIKKGMVNNSFFNLGNIWLQKGLRQIHPMVFIINHFELLKPYRQLPH
ncbi:unnamed protein product [Paramecium pentaurelia]|uniref:Transmembrane protein n=1 Tax=Paramecium pentaurelia TaxID=43138 RepID=A0A8S1Y7R7_9CILI|nr:unnamed protein product [Paramecium pentaurelia]